MLLFGLSFCLNSHLLDIGTGMEGAEVTNTVVGFLFFLIVFWTNLYRYWRRKVHWARNRNPWILSFQGWNSWILEMGVLLALMFQISINPASCWECPARTVITDCTGLPDSLSAWWSAGPMVCLLVESYYHWRLWVKHGTEVPGPPGTWAWAVNWDAFSWEYSADLVGLSVCLSLSLSPAGFNSNSVSLIPAWHLFSWSKKFKHLGRWGSGRKLTQQNESFVYFFVTGRRGDWQGRHVWGGCVKRMLSVNHWNRSLHVEGEQQRI